MCAGAGVGQIAELAVMRERERARESARERERGRARANKRGSPLQVLIQPPAASIAA